MEDFNRSFLELRLDLKSPELELELKITELELELNWKNGIDPNPVLGMGSTSQRRCYNVPPSL